MYIVKIAKNWSLPAAVLPVGELSSRIIYNIATGKEKRPDRIRDISLKIFDLCIRHNIPDAIIYVSDGMHEMGMPVHMLINQLH